MRMSMNEVLTMCQRAAVGAGLPVGLAEDCAAASVWLETTGLNGVRVFRRALDGYLAGRTTGVTLETGAGRQRLLPMGDGGRGASALFAGPALSDRVAVHGAGRIAGPVEAHAVDEPILALACVVAGLHRAPDTLTIHWLQGAGRLRCEARCRDGAWSLWGDDGAVAGEPGPVDLLADLGSPGAPRDMASLFTEAAIAEALEHSHARGVQVAAGDYERVNASARKVLVADSPHSRLAGAGAGLHDND
jgi:hypothetical protein